MVLVATLLFLHENGFSTVRWLVRGVYGSSLYRVFQQHTGEINNGCQDNNSSSGVSLGRQDRLCMHTSIELSFSPDYR
ncbi:uncharacterized protein ASPGLDRAFT_51150 [Aspergillus glaucus CBS 516.65]|uniref:Uncharacterized protein n=1 Tax=Aspergillus glaucus CBS 516.65 TaxID=1160497 RepID=A0A1L9V9Y0_ASPGL|nr:hypothetical protein ASPGLDRAFT_51150 [Aspergillus glaucus CBS 516.65]OJJ80734.1 hypothetical protein ASPGLDRAFT_51150 [Aspergillus glaucus CBS 516.65]